MGSGVIQLVSYGVQDMYFIHKPTITFFKVLYKRHTNFAIEPMPQLFNTKADFGNRVTCTIAKNADLINRIYLIVNLPPIGKFLNIPNESGAGNSNIACCAWTKNIGYQLIKRIDLEIGGFIIDRHYSDWFNIWYEITVPITKRAELDAMIGNVPELYELTNSKQGYLLYIPLLFWFCRFPNLALPLVSLYNTDVNINVEFNSLDQCLILGPTHYIKILDSICLFVKGEILQQTINNIIYYYKFIYFDYHNNNLYYIKITPEILLQSAIIYSVNNPNYFVTPNTTHTETLYYNLPKYFSHIINLALGNSFLLVDYVFLDSPERLKFAKNENEYLIDVLTYDTEKILYHANNKIKVNYGQTCKEFIFRCNYNYITSGYILDAFNYTTCIINGSNIINTALLLLNGQERFKQQSIEYFEYIQSFMYHTTASAVGINIYSFAIEPEKHQPSGYCNLSKMDDIEIDIIIDKNVSNTRYVTFRIYAVTYNILKINNGIASLVF